MTGRTRRNRRSARTADRGVNMRVAAKRDTYPSACLARRLVALLYDWILLAAVLFTATGVVLLFRGGAALPPNSPWYSAYLIATGLLFFGWFWTHGGQTLGMRAWRLKLIDEGGFAVGWRQALIRGLVALPSALLLGLGYLWMLIDPERRCWQDIASNSRIYDLR